LNYLLIILFGFSPALVSANSESNKFYFATSADTEHYNWLCTQIQSIHQYDLDRLGAIAVFDLGLTPQERAHVESLSHVAVYDVEPVNPYLFTKFPTLSGGRYPKRGWFSWKPVAIKMALDLFPYVLYMDAGIKLNRSAAPLFAHIKEKGYFLIQSHWIYEMATQWVIKKFGLDTPEKQWILSEIGISAGLQGLSRKVYDSYVYPMYTLAKDIRNFEDDGTCPRGFGFGRHDQALFSIMAKDLGFEILGGASFKLSNNARITLSDYISFKPE